MLDQMSAEELLLVNQEAFEPSPTWKRQQWWIWDYIYMAFTFYNKGSFQRNFFLPQNSEPHPMIYWIFLIRPKNVLLEAFSRTHDNLGICCCSRLLFSRYWPYTSFTWAYLQKKCWKKDTKVRNDDLLKEWYDDDIGGCQESPNLGDRRPNNKPGRNVLVYLSFCHNQPMKVTSPISKSSCLGREVPYLVSSSLMASSMSSGQMRIMRMVNPPAPQ